MDFREYTQSHTCCTEICDTEQQLVDSYKTDGIGNQLHGRQCFGSDIVFREEYIVAGVWCM